jgi:hypothetical protein
MSVVRAAAVGIRGRAAAASQRPDDAPFSIALPKPIQSELVAPSELLASKSVQGSPPGTTGG